MHFMPTIEKRTNKAGETRWRARVRRRGFPLQDQTFLTKADALRWTREMERGMDRGQFAERDTSSLILLSTLLSRYRQEIAPQKKGARQDITLLERLLARPIAQLSVAALTPARLAQYRDERLAQGVSGQTVRHELAMFSRVVEQSSREWGVSCPHGNPVKQIRLPSPSPSRTRRLLDGEERRLLEAAQKHGDTIGLIMTWAIETAMRRGEIAAMRWEHMNHKARVLLVPETKNGTPRRVPLSTVAMEVLTQTLSSRKGGLPQEGTVPSGPIWGYGKDAISQSFVRTCQTAGIEGLTFHDLRHEATSRLFEKGLNPMQVAAITGHKTLQMLKRYTHLKAEDLVGMLG
jgi:integrase